MNPTVTGVRNSPAVSASRQSCHTVMARPYHRSGLASAQGCFIEASARAIAATVMTAPTEPPNVYIAAACCAIAAASICGWPGPFRSRKYPMALAVKKPARLAPPAAATIIGRGQAGRIWSVSVGVHPQVDGMIEGQLGRRVFEPLPSRRSDEPNDRRR